MRGEVAVQRSDRGRAAHEGGDVAARRELDAVTGDELAADGAVGVAEVDQAGEGFVGGVGDFEAGDLGERAVGRVDVEQLGRAAGEQPAGDGGPELRGRVEVFSVDAAGGDGDGGQTADVALHGSHHGAGVEHVAPDIRAGVDAGDDHADAARRVAAQADADGVDRGAVDLPGVDALDARVGALGFEVVVEGQGGAGAGLVEGGCGDHDVAVAAHRVGEQPEAVGVDAVVVADEDQRAFGHGGRVAGALTPTLNYSPTGS